MFLYKHFIQGPETTEMDDIMRNLSFVLKTKRGCGYFLPSFGLSDAGFRTLEETVVTLTEEIKENIRLYEPRVELSKIDEVYDDEGKRVRLVVNLRLRDASEKLKLVVDLAKRTFDIEPVRKDKQG
jgi:phage baseplate assembly protein W